ncbi:olfactory receptor 6F1-like [Bufo gargarizans]|uniref:olfactory receptor 6F1-like n=1 Tax=Bufo gargarizans TaxID=30331 RepID=UPI001CF4B112|nr:olfactory receptor 6F1-like [Bufo gargarizans]
MSPQAQQMSVDMIHVNQTKFFLVGFTLGPSAQNTVFLLFFILYLISLIGNLSIITAVWLDKRLHTPMYFFLSSLAFLDIWFISSTVPKLLMILAYNSKIISISGCILQLYFYVSLGTIEFYLLAVMSVDRYVAISYPLRYHSIITNKVCLSLVLISWVFGFITFIYPTVLMFGLSFCGPYEINHFFCDSSAVVKISCSDIHQFDMVFASFASAVILGSFCLTLISYCNILFTIIMIPSTRGKIKAFSTCASHFTVVSLVYGSAIFIYVRPVESSSPDLNKVVALLNSVMTPVLNPFIYTLRNRQVQQVFREIGMKFVPNKSSILLK